MTAEELLDILDHLPERVRERRLALGMSQSQVALIAGWEQTSQSRFELHQRGTWLPYAVKLACWLVDTDTETDTETGVARLRELIDG